MNIAYLTNLYPKVSHTFIRREIFALERLGCRVSRFAVRPTTDRLVDPADQHEQQQTRALLDHGPLGLIAPTLAVLLVRPVRFLATLLLAIRIGWGSDRGPLIHLAYLMEACRLLRWLRAENIDHLHAHFGTNPAAVAMLCRALGGPPYSFTVHGPYEFDHAPSLALDRKIAHAAFVVAISDFCRSQLYRWCDHQDWAKIRVVRCGLDREFLQRSPPPVPDRPRLLCVGRLCEQKGQLLLVEAAHQLVTRGIDFELLLVGDGPMRDQIQKLIERFNLADRVRITGWLSGGEIRHQLHQSRAMVLPSFAEGLPVVFMEALATGRPVISTHVAGIPELVRPDDNGWLIPPGSVNALTDAMQQALATPADRLTAMGRAGARRVAELHDSDRQARRLEALFRAGPHEPDQPHPEPVDPATAPAASTAPGP